MSFCSKKNFVRRSSGSATKGRNVQNFSKKKKKKKKNLKKKKKKKKKNKKKKKKKKKKKIKKKKINLNKKNKILYILFTNFIYFYLIFRLRKKDNKK